MRRRQQTARQRNRGKHGDSAVSGYGSRLSGPGLGNEADAASAVATRLVSVTLAARGIELSRFLSQSYGRERFYWAEPGGGADSPILLGSGVAAELAVMPTLTSERDDDAPDRFAGIAAQLAGLYEGSILLTIGPQGVSPADSATHPGRPRLFGGFSFQPDFTPDNTWSHFRPAHFVLPHYQGAIEGDEAWLTINALAPLDDDPATTAAELHEALQARLELLQDNLLRVAYPPTPHFANRDGEWLSYPMGQEQWTEIVCAATDAIHNGDLQKVVLARVCEARLPGPIDAAAPLGFLDRRYADCFRFLFEAMPNHAFFGASPELLVRRVGRAVETMALAGSIRRGRSASEDDALAAELLASAKDQHEHALVARMVRSRLAGLAESLKMPDQPEIMRLRNIQHLHTPVRGRLHPEDPATALQLVRVLHPTPALGGVPREGALSFISAYEPVPRGWYAGPVGWLDRELNGAFAVAIRSAVTHFERAWLYAGAGIVGDSDPDKEWAETALKFRPMLEALGEATIKEIA